MGCIGVLLLNLGTPDAPTPTAVRRYLAEFLRDPRVLDLPSPGRELLLYGLVLPFRPPKSAAAYRTIWTKEGSPLLIHGKALRDGLQAELGPGYRVDLAMRYAEPTVAQALDRFDAADVDEIVLVPLYPQFATSSTASSLAHCYAEAGKRVVPPTLRPIGAFYDHPAFLDAVAASIQEVFDQGPADHLLFSMHGLPQRHVRMTDRSGQVCRGHGDCCETIGPANRHCYRAQSLATARGVAHRLGLPAERWSMAFQSRLGREPWLQPYTDHRLPELAAGGVRELVVACPSFVADCLETIEEIGLRADAQFRGAGGTRLRLVPCLNSRPDWVKALAQMVRRP